MGQTVAGTCLAGGGAAVVFVGAHDEDEFEGGFEAAHLPAAINAAEGTAVASRIIIADREPSLETRNIAVP